MKVRTDNVLAAVMFRRQQGDKGKLTMITNKGRFDGFSRILSQKRGFREKEGLKRTFGRALKCIRKPYLKELDMQTGLLTYTKRRSGRMEKDSKDNR